MNAAKVDVPRGFNVDTLFDALVQQESQGLHKGGLRSGGPEGFTRSLAGAIGLTQFMPESALDPGFGAEPLIPPEHRSELWTMLYAARAQPQGSAERARLMSEYNARAEEVLMDVPEEQFAKSGYQYMVGLINHYGSVEGGLAAYNYGPGNMNRLIAAHPDDWRQNLPSETEDYVRTITRSAGIPSGID